MQRSRFRLGTTGLMAVVAAVSIPATAWAADSTEALRQEVEALKREIAELKAGLRERQAISKDEAASIRREVAEAVKTASEEKNALSSKHFGGYADIGYTDAKNSSSAFDRARFNPAFHFQYLDLVALDAELEIATTANGETETGLEFATVNLFAHDYANVYAGKFNSGIGQFRQNLHPGWINRMPSTPVGFDHDQAAPTTEVGAGVRGAFPVGAIRLTYDVWVGNGPRLELSGAGDEIEMIEATGSTSDPDGKKIWGGRLGLFPVPNLELGLSAASGKVAVVQGGLAERARKYEVFGADGAYRWRNLDLRAEYVSQKVGDQADSVAPMGGKVESLVCAGRLSPGAHQVGGRGALRRLQDAPQEPEPGTVGGGRELLVRAEPRRQARL